METPLERWARGEVWNSEFHSGTIQNLAQRLLAAETAIEFEAQRHRNVTARKLLAEGGGPPVLFDIVKRQQIEGCTLCRAAKPFHPEDMETCAKCSQVKEDSPYVEGEIRGHEFGMRDHEFVTKQQLEEENDRA